MDYATILLRLACTVHSFYVTYTGDYPRDFSPALRRGVGGYVLLVLPPYIAGKYGQLGRFDPAVDWLFLGRHRARDVVGAAAPPSLAAPGRTAARRLASRRQLGRRRQGLLLGLTVVILTTLSALGALDIIIVLVTILLAGLVEALPRPAAEVIPHEDWGSGFCSRPTRQETCHGLPFV